MTNDETKMLFLIKMVATLEKQLEQAMNDGDMLAAEVLTWRNAKYQCNATWDAEERTDESGALQRVLQRAKEAK